MQKLRKRVVKTLSYCNSNIVIGFMLKLSLTIVNSKFIQLYFFSKKICPSNEEKQYILQVKNALKKSRISTSLTFMYYLILQVYCNSNISNFDIMSLAEGWRRGLR